VLNAAADWLAVQLRSTFSWRVMGPEYPLVSRIRSLYLKQITLRFERNEAIADAKRIMMLMADELIKQEGWSGVSVIFDVDPC
jgi:primosomal protein N' (replication factor Y)